MRGEDVWKIPTLGVLLSRNERVLGWESGRERETDRVCKRTKDSGAVSPHGEGRELFSDVRGEKVRG